MESNQNNEYRITTDDLAFSAYLKLKGHRLINHNHIKSKSVFTFQVDKDASEMKMDFINSDFVNYYNELRNLKKMI
jgi:hypothetical protein